MGELLETMDGVELQRWLEMAQIDPFTPDRGDLQAALICSTLAQVHGAKDVKASDFLPTFGPPVEREPQTDEEIEHGLKKVCAMLGGKFKKRAT